ncbi:MAG: hypothetical protein U0931_14285 [Vulcanimicrobiota bacterium]
MKVVGDVLMTLHSVIGSMPGESRATRARLKLEQAAVQPIGLTPAELGQRLAYCNKTLDDIARVRVGAERTRLLELMPGTADFAEVEAATELLPTDTPEAVQTREDYRDAYIQARRSATRASWGKPLDQVFPLEDGVLVEGPGRLLIQQGTSVYQGLEGTRGQLFQIQNGQPVREAAALTAAGPMPSSFLDRGPVNYNALSLLNLESLLLDKLADPLAPGDVVDGINAGKPWGPRSVLKWDEFPGRQHFKDGGLFKAGEDQADAPNYRQLPDYPVHGVAQPSRAGLKRIFEKMVREHGSQTPVFWVNTRAEAVLYIDGKPYNVRELSSLLNLPYREGASGEELERLEQQLKEMLIERGSVPVQVEGSGAVQEVPVHAANLRTTREEMTEAAREAGVELDYHRIPVRDESAPSPQELDLLRTQVERFHSAHPDKQAQYFVNCHMGRGRTTTGMIAIAMTLDALNGQSARSTPGEQRTSELEDQASQVVDLSLAIVQNDLDLEKDRHQLAQEQARTPQNFARIKQLKSSLPEHERRAREYRDRQLELEMYSLYLSTASKVTFTEWINLPEQQATLAARRQRLEEQVRQIETGHHSRPQAQASKLLAQFKAGILARVA